MTFYRIESGDPRRLLDPANWVSTPWLETMDGHDGTRRGVSVCPTVGELARYADEAWMDMRDTVLVELDGDISDDEDYDARAAERIGVRVLLLLPSRIISVTPVADVEELADVLARDEAER